MIRGPARKKQLDELLVHSNQILADNLERRLVGCRSSQHGIFHLANSVAQMYLQLAVTIRMVVGVRLLFPQSIDGGTHIVAVFFQCKSSSVVIAVVFVPP